MRRDPDFNVNKDHRGGLTLFHCACYENHRSAVIPLLLAHPDIDVSVKSKYGETPFYWACGGRPSCVREMLKDFRVKLNDPANDGSTPLWSATRFVLLDIMKWWIGSGREIDLGKPGDVDKTDAIEVAKNWGRTEMATLLQRFKNDPAKTRHAVRLEIGWYDEAAAEIFALVVFVSDGLLQINETTTATPAARFINIARRLPLELQMLLCHRVVGSSKEINSGQDSEVAFKSLAKRLIWSSIFTK